MLFPQGKETGFTMRFLLFFTPLLMLSAGGFAFAVLIGQEFGQDAVNGITKPESRPEVPPSQKVGTGPQFLNEAEIIAAAQAKVSHEMEASKCRSNCEPEEPVVIPTPAVPISRTAPRVRERLKEVRKVQPIPSGRSVEISPRTISIEVTPPTRPIREIDPSPAPRVVQPSVTPSEVEPVQPRKGVRTVPVEVPLPTPQETTQPRDIPAESVPPTVVVPLPIEVPTSSEP
jgi:hypothetical protein